MPLAPEISVIQENGNIRVSWIYPEPFPDAEGYIYNEGTHEDEWVEGYIAYDSQMVKQDNHILLDCDEVFDAEATAVTDDLISLDDWVFVKAEGVFSWGASWALSVDISGFTGDYYVRVHHVLDEYGETVLIVSTDKDSSFMTYDARDMVSGSEDTQSRVYKVWLE